MTSEPHEKQNICFGIATRLRIGKTDQPIHLNMNADKLSWNLLNA